MDATFSPIEEPLNKKEKELSKKERWWAEPKKLIAGGKAKNAYRTQDAISIEKHDSPLAQLSILFKQNDVVLKMMNEGGGKE